MAPSPLKQVARIVRCDKDKDKEKEGNYSTSATADPNGSRTESSAGAESADQAALDMAALNIIDGETGAQLVSPSDLTSINTAPAAAPRLSIDSSTSTSTASTPQTGTPTTPTFFKNPLASISNKCKERRAARDEASPFQCNGPQPAVQLFNVFKALAAATPRDDGMDGEVDTDSEDSVQKRNSQQLSHSGSEPRTSVSTESPSENTTVMSEGTVHRRNLDNDDNDVALALEKAHADAAAAATSAAGTDSEVVKRWLQDTVSRNEAMGKRLAALSVSSLSPYSGDVAGPHVLRTSPTPLDADLPESDDEWHPAVNCQDPEHLPKVVASELPLPEVENLDDLATLSESNLISRFSRDQIPAAEKLEVIQEEFGDIASTMENAQGVSEPEKLLAESQGSLFKGVMMIGNLHLTTHRLVFHALLPPDQMYEQTDTTFPAQTEAEATARSARPDIVIAGPVSIHRTSIVKAKKRVWMELTPDMLTTYPSADEAGRVRPLYSILMSSTLKLAPFDEKRPFDFYLHYWTSDAERVLHFTVDNEASALRWRRHFEGVLYRYARERFREAHCRDTAAAGLMSEAACQSAPAQWSLLRCCVPLDRATIKGIGEFHSFATLVNLEVELEKHVQVTWHPEELTKGNYEAYGLSKVTSPTEMSSPTRSRSLRLSSLKRGLPRREGSRDRSRDRSPLIGSPTTASFKDDDAQSDKSDKSSDRSRFSTPTYFDTSLPPRLQSLTLSKFRTTPPAIKTAEPEEMHNTFNFLVAVLNGQSWFAASLESALEAAHLRHYKADATPAGMVLDVGGYDCLAMDDELDSSSNGDVEGEGDDDDESGKPKMVIETRKAEKAAMAARIFGLREDEGIWLKRCYVDHGVIPARGHIIVSPRYICFWRRARVGSDIKYRFSTQDVKGAVVASPIRLGLYGLAIKIHGHHDLRLEMFNEKGRDEVIHRINAVCAAEHDVPPSPVSTSTTGSNLSHASSAPAGSTLSHASTASTLTTVASEPSAEAATPADSAAPTPTTTASHQTAEDIWSNQTSRLSTAPDFAVNPVLLASGGQKVLKAAADVLAPPPEMLLYPKAMTEQALSYMPFVANRPWALNTGWNVRLTPRRFTMLTIGSRGDVQPYIALALRLMQDGHKVVIVTHDEFKKWIEGYGIEHRQAGGDPTALMKLSTEHRMFSPGFFKEALGGFRAWLDELLLDAWKACHDADVLIESPSAMAGVHIAEALKIPYFRAFTMPWTRTAAYPQAFMVPAFEMGPSFNYSTYVLFDNIMWRATSGQINRWRKKHLGLGATDMSSLSISKVPFLYNFSPAVVPKPLDWYDDIMITGYWNLENSDTDWSPPSSLIDWMDKARADGKPIVYIGFGSIVVPDPQAVTKSIVKGVQKSGVRAIIAKGWSARDSKPSSDPPFEYPESCYALDKVPHGWLFPKIQAAMHHGGAGTVGASLRAGIPTLIKPWFGDQHFWALRVSKLGVGMKVASMRSDDIAEALSKATSDTVMIEKAARIGERIRSESGVDAAVQAIHFNIVRAARDRTKLKKEDSKRRGESGSLVPSLPKPSLGMPSLPGLPSFHTIATTLKT